MFKRAVLFLFLFILSVSNILSQVDNLSDSSIRRKAEELGIDLKSRNKFGNEKEHNVRDSSQVEIRQNILYKPLPDSLFRLPSFSNRKLAKELPAFGYNFFNYFPNSFEPGKNIPVPLNYQVGPGDELVISLWGETQSVENLTVRNDGKIFIPNVGLVKVSGLTLKQLKVKLKNILSKRYSSLDDSNKEARTFLDVATGKLRTVKIFVLGEVNRPGGYTLPANSSTFTALYYSGGPSLKGSLRNIYIIRKGKRIAKVDLYNYLLAGKTNNDIALHEADVVFVPPTSKRVAISGAVFRPAIYEIADNESLKDLITYCGGLNYNAYIKNLEIERIVPFNNRNKYKNSRLVISLNFNNIKDLLASDFILEDGDVIDIKTVDSLYENKLVIDGEVLQPGMYQFKNDTMKVSDLIRLSGGLKATAFLQKALLIRTFPTKKKEVFYFNLKQALRGDKKNNIILNNLDSVYIFNLNYINPSKIVEISGEVKNPGKYIRFKGLTLSKLLMIAGGVTDSASLNKIELTRMDTTNQTKYSDKITVSLRKDFWNTPQDSDPVLKDFDRVLINADPNKTYNKTVTVSGEVLYPGTYTILYEGEKVYDIVQRAGGLRETAYKRAIYVKRSNPIFELVKKPSLPDSLVKYKSFFQTSILTGFSDRIPINWDDIVADPNTDENIEVEPNDTINIPNNPNVVYVVGEVGIPATVKYKKNASLSYYINQAGGYTQNSDEGGEIVILPNGRKWETSGWFFIPNPEILSGSTILVPTIYEIKRDAWPIIRDTFSIISSATIIILTVYNLTRP
ncbi:polysialic acid transport protein KpsD precursor [bacterium BMS3Abin04]|nr:polysialic acid transport protein KpsD precursor [bacterium BMS3Abin04]